MTLADVCDVAEYCFYNHGIKVYENRTDCEQFLLTIPHGSNMNLYSNAVNCRSVHQNLAWANPTVHCPHVGKNSAVCRDRPYSEFYKTRAIPNFSPIVVFETNATYVAPVY